MSAPASPMKPTKVPKPDKPAPPPPPKVTAPPAENDDDDDLPPPEDDPEEEESAPPVPQPVVTKKPSNSPPPPPPSKVAKAAPLTPPPVLQETAPSTVDRNGVKSFVNPALAGKVNSMPAKPARTASPTPPPRATSAPSPHPPTESEKADAEGEETSAKRGSIFTSVSHGLRKALRNSLIATGVDSGSSPAVVDENVLKEGMLSKMNREGKFEKYKVVLRKEEFFYTQDKDATGGHDEDGDGAAATTSSSSSAAAEHDRHEIPLVSMIVLELHDKDLVDSEKRGRCFKLLSKTKSFYLRAKTEELKNEWFQEIFAAVKIAQDKANVTPQLEDMAPLWNTGDPNCQLCGRAFSFFTRKHHCRNCGKCVCELCSRDKVRILRIDEKKLFKVCNPCGEEIKNNRRYGV